MFATNVWNIVLIFATYFSTDVPSVQKKDRSTVIPNSRFIILSSLTETLAADSSNRGIIIFFKETILDLDIKMVQ